MKRFLSLLCMVALTVLSVNATDFDFSSSIPAGWTSSVAQQGFEADRGIQYTQTASLTYKGVSNVTTVTIVASSNIANGYSLGVSVGGQTFGKTVSLPKENKKTFTFTGSNAASGDVVVTITKTGSSKSAWIKTISIDGTTGPVTPDKERLDSSYVYSEPTTILPKDSVGKVSLDTVINNVLLQCFNGALYATDIRVMAGSSISFSTTKNMKAIVIKGKIKKGFEATASAGTISYVQADEEDKEGDPVLLIKDIDTTNVTINCVKQLQCQAINIYFEANPDIEIGGDTPIESEIVVTGDIPFVGGQVTDDYYEYFGSIDIDLWTFSDWQQGDDGYLYPLGNGQWMTLEIYPVSASNLSGTYSLADETLDAEYSDLFTVNGTDTTDLTFTAANVTITRSNDSIYNVSYSVTTTDGRTYSGTASGLYYVSSGEDIIYVSVEEAIAIGQSLNDNETTEETYCVLGYVAKAYDAKNNTQTFFMTDTVADGQGYYDFEAYNAEIEEAVSPGDFVYVVGPITKYVNKNNAVTIEIANGYAAILPTPSGLKNTFIRPLDKNAVMYNMHGMRVDKTYRGIIIQEGYKYLLY